MKTALYRPDDNEFLGFLSKENSGWHAQTIFGYTIARTATQKEAEAILRDQGLGFLNGVWQYYDKEDYDWFPCVIKDAQEHKVTIIRTNYMGYQEPETYKLVSIENPSESLLIKSH